MIRLTRLDGWRGNLVALSAGAALSLSFAPFYLWPLALFSLSILFLLVLRLERKTAFLRGWYYGLGMFGVGISWIYVSIHYFGNASPPLAAVFTLIFAAFLALFPAMVAYLAIRLMDWYRADKGRYHFIELLLLLPAIWGLLEWLRGWVLTGLPWLNPAYSQVEGPLAGFAPILGVYGLNWLIAISAGLLAMLWLQWRQRPLPYLAALLVIFALGYGLNRVEWTAPIGSPLKVSLIQGNIPQDQKWAAGQLQNTLAIYSRLTAQHWDSDLIVWPEAALSTWYHNVENGFLSELERKARETDTDMLIGIPYYDFANKTMYNSVINLSNEPRRFYHKHHLVPFGDYLPFEHNLRGLIAFFDLPMSSFSPGSAVQAPLAVAGHSVGVSICYEDIFGEEVIRNLPIASFLVNVSNDSWWGDSHGPHQHMQMAAMRSLETGRPLLRAANNGVTAVVDYKGHIRQSLPQFTTDVLTTEIQPRMGSTPYVRLGNTLAVILMALTLIAVLLWRRRMLRQQE